MDKYIEAYGRRLFGLCMHLTCLLYTSYADLSVDHGGQACASNGAAAADMLKS